MEVHAKSYLYLAGTGRGGLRPSSRLKVVQPCEEDCNDYSYSYPDMTTIKILVCALAYYF